MGKVFLGGFSNIHIAKMTQADTATQAPQYEALSALPGGKSVEVSLNYEGVQFFCDNIVGYQDNFFSGGEITLTLAGLTQDEYTKLFGNVQGQKGMMGVGTNDSAPTLAITFERKKLGSNEVRKYVLYAVTLSPGSISAETLTDSVTEENIEVTGVVRQLANNNLVYAFADSDHVGKDEPTFNGWHTEVKMWEQ